MNPRVWKIGVFIVCLGLAACAARRPVLYPNERVRQAGGRIVQRDVNDCLRRADHYASSGAAKEQMAGDVAGGTAVGAATGGAIGAVGGAVYGDAGRGAAAGAATGATAGFVRGLLHGFRRGPSQVYKNFVERCLRAHGYETIGWQ